MKKILAAAILAILFFCPPAWGADPQEAEDMTGVYTANLGFAEMLRGPTSKGDVLFREALASRAAGDYPGAFGKWDKAIELYMGKGNLSFWDMMNTPGLVLIAELGDQSKKVVAAYVEIGSAHLEINEFDQALEAFQKALVLSEKSKTEAGVTAAMIGLAAVYGRLGDDAAALDYLEKALGNAGQSGDVSGQIKTRNGIGGIYYRKKEYDKALAEYRKSLALARQSNDEKGIQDAGLSIGFSLAGLSMYTEAAVSLEEGLAFARMRKDIPGILDGLNRKADCFAETGRPGDARLAIREGLGLLSVMDVTLPEQRIAAQAGMAKIQQRTGDMQGAAGSYLSSIADIEDTRSRIESGEHRAGYFEGKIAIYENLIDILMGSAKFDADISGLGRYGKTNAEIAFFYAESTRARSFLESLSKSRLDSLSGRLPADIAREEEKLLNRVAALQAGRGAVSGKSSRKEMLARAKADLNNHIEKLKRDYPDYAAIRYPEPSALRNIPLRTGEALVAFKVNQKATYVWLARKGQEPASFTIPVSRDELTARVRAFRAPLEDAARLAEFDPGKGEQLYRLLVADALRGVGPEEQVIIVPDGPLTILPFEALATGTSKMKKTAGTGGIPVFSGVRYLGDDYRISYYPSASIMAVVRKMGAKGKRVYPLFALGDPVYDEADARYRNDSPARETVEAGANRLREIVTRSGYSIPRLPETRDEVLAIAGLFRYPQDDPRIKLDLGATKSEVLKADLAGGQYLHFATHGILGGDIPYILEPALVMTQVNRKPGDDGFLKMSDVLAMKLNADMVVLSACKTALGREVAGEGIVGLSRAFMLAGSKSVIVSFWSVESNATAALMKRFYEHLNEGKPRGEALRLAKREFQHGNYLLEGERGLKIVSDKKELPGAHPFFWAPFVLVGEWE